MKIELINDALLSELHEKARGNERLRMNHDLRTTPADNSQRMLNALEVGTKVPIHRHSKTAETVICMEGCIDWIIYEEIPSASPYIEGEVATDESRLKEVARHRLCPREQKFGIQLPPATWHSVEVYEPSTIFEAKDGAYGK